MQRSMKLWAALAGTALVAAGLSGCSTPADTDNGEELPQIWYINVLTSYDLYNTSQKLFEQYADELGYEAFTAGSSTVDIPEQISLVNQAIASGADAILFCDLDPKSYEKTIKDAQAKGVVMITTGGCVDEISDYSVGTDNYAFGEVAAQTVADGAGEDAKVVIFGTDDTIPSQVTQREGFTDFAEANFPDMEVLAVESTKADPAQAASKIAAAVVAYPEADVFWFIEGAGLSALPKSLEQAGKLPGDIFVLGIDSTPETISAIESGWVSSSLAQCFFYATPFAAQLAMKKLAGDGPGEQSYPVDVVPVYLSDLPFTECPSSAFPGID
jgi:ribose transport system substrate-binding protein